MWVVFISILSLLNGHIFKKFSFNFFIPPDKVIHFVFYGILVLLVIRALSLTFKVTYKIYLVSVITAVSYGVLMELCQKFFTTTRTADIKDVFANCIGIFTVLLFYHIYKKMVKYN